MPGTLLIATHNAHKTDEMRTLLGDLFDSIEDLTAMPGLVPPEENGDTFAENSAIKALATSRERPDAIVLADDSGLEVDALGGAPGIAGGSALLIPPMQTFHPISGFKTGIPPLSSKPPSRAV